ncbi:MAG: ABC transporter permease [Clostridia bacterium]|jgi:putative ABC transport system permease protein|nr:ABC transporter permease [Clostridia bacterium]MDH7573191.1 ABC transporter permease [Clostridia bacterium]
MSFWDALLTAVKSLSVNRTRSLLTALGVVIGVAAIIALVGLGEGLSARVTQQFTEMGANLITVMPGYIRASGSVVVGGQGQLTQDDFELLSQRLDPGLVAGIAPEASRMGQVKYQNANTMARIVGTTPEYMSVRNSYPDQGSFFDQTHLEGRRHVAVLGAQVAGDLFGEASPVGQKVKIEGMSFTVIGVMEAKGQEGFGSTDSQVLVPLNTFQARLGRGGLSSIYIAARSREVMDALQAQVTALMRQSHRLAEGEEDDFNVMNQATVLSSLNQTMGMITLFLAGIAAISLVVGGIGIMNVMLIGVAERTREIGIRLAVGARRRDVLLQFLLESLVLSLVGGAAGIALGIAGAYGLGQFAGTSALIKPSSVLLGLAFALAVGIFFGLYPARRAAGLQPAVALRYE